MNRKSIALIAAGAACALGLSLLGVVQAAAWLDGRHHQESSSYDTGAQAKADRKSMPSWLPDDATSVTYLLKTTGDQRLLKATLANGKLPTACEAEARNEAKEPDIKADWFPENARAKATARCGQYDAYTDGTTLYAWQD